MILIPSILDSLSTLKDGTIKLVFETQELTPEKVGELFGYRNKMGYLAFKPELFQKDEVEIFDKLKADEFEGSKSPSQRMRNVFYVLWQKQPEGYADFNLYYQFRMNQIIEKLKEKLT
jgi:hypothetical protein